MHNGLYNTCLPVFLPHVIFGKPFFWPLQLMKPTQAAPQESPWQRLHSNGSSALPWPWPSPPPTFLWPWREPVRAKRWHHWEWLPESGDWVVQRMDVVWRLKEVRETCGNKWTMNGFTFCSLWGPKTFVLGTFWLIQLEAADGQLCFGSARMSTLLWLNERAACPVSIYSTVHHGFRLSPSNLKS